MIAITRDVSDSIQRCELTHLGREPIDVDRARAQHREYVELLEQLGCDVHALPAASDLPDSVFVEDAALVFDEVAVLMRPGAASRRPEVDSVAVALAPLRPLVRIEPPATVDGGDVLVVDRDVYVGLSTRSTRAGIDQLAALVAPHGYTVRAIEVRGCLHLKTAVTWIAPDTLVLNPEWVDRSLLGRRRFVEVEASEPFAANAVRVGCEFDFGQKVGVGRGVVRTS